MPHDVVISYSRRNRDIADRFAGLLRERGLDVWYDRMIRTGADWRDEIARAIAGSRSFVILFSAESNDSEELKKEYSIADRRELVIIPIRVENVEPTGFFEYELSRRQWFDAFSERDTQLVIAADQLAEALKPSGAEPPRRDPAQAKVAEPERQPGRPPESAKTAAPTRSFSLNLTLAILNFLLGLFGPYLIVWPIAYAAFVWTIALRRPTPALVKWYSIAILAVPPILVTTVFLLGVSLLHEITPVVTWILVPAGVLLAGYLAYETLNRKSPVAFWIAPVLGGAVAVLTTYLGVLWDLSVYASAVGMTLANAAFLFDAWQRMKSPKP